MATSSFLSSTNCYLPQGPVKRLYPNLFCVVIAEPGNGKSLIATIVEDIIEHYNETSIDDPLNLAPNISNPASFIQKLMRSGRRERGCESIHPVVAIISELAVGIEDTSFGNFLTNLLDMYDCRKTFTKYTKTDGDEILERPIPVIYGATTPSQWRDLSGRKNIIGDGFTSRTLLYTFDEFIERDGDIKWGTIEDIREINKEAYRVSALRGQFSFSKEAYSFFNNVFTPENNELMRRHYKGSDLWQGYTNRRSDQLKKLGMIFSAAEKNNLIIEKIHLDKGLRVLRMIEENLDMLLTKSEARRPIVIRDRIIQLLQKNGSMTDKALLRALSESGVLILFDDFLRVIRTLDAEGIIRKDNEKNDYIG